MELTCTLMFDVVAARHRNHGAELWSTLLLRKAPGFICGVFYMHSAAVSMQSITLGSL